MFSDDDQHSASSKLCFTCGFGFGFGLSCRGALSRNRGGCHIAAISPFWCQTVTSSNNKFLTTTTEKLLEMHLLGKLLRIFLSFWETYFCVQPGCVSLGITITRNAFFSTSFCYGALLFQKILHHSGIKI